MTSRRLLDPIARTLLDADDYIESRGWCQGSSTDIFGRVCIWQALQKVSPSLNDAHNAGLRLMHYLGFQATAVPEWNDKVCKTREQAGAALRGAALAA